MFSRKRCVWALFSLQWNSPSNKAEISSHNMLSEDVANRTSSNLHCQNKKTGQWRWNSSSLRMPDLAKPNTIIPSWRGKMGTKVSSQLWLISFPLPEAGKDHTFKTPAEGPKAADFSPGFGAGRWPAARCRWPGVQHRAMPLSSNQHCVKTSAEAVWRTCLHCVVLSHGVPPALWKITVSHCGGRREEGLQKHGAGFLLYLPLGQRGWEALVRCLPSERDKTCVLGKLGLAQSCVCGDGVSPLGLMGDRAGHGTAPLRGLAVTFSWDPSAGSVSAPAWRKPRDNWVVGLGGSVFCYGYFAVSLLRLKFLHWNIWLLNSMSRLARGKVSLLLPGNELCISVLLGVKKTLTIETHA